MDKDYLHIIAIVLCSGVLLQNFIVLILYIRKSDFVIKTRPLFAVAIVIAETVFALLEIVLAIERLQLPYMIGNPKLFTLRFITYGPLIVSQWCQFAFVLDKLVLVKCHMRYKLLFTIKRRRIFLAFICVIGLGLTFGNIFCPPMRMEISKSSTPEQINGQTDGNSNFSSINTTYTNGSINQNVTQKPQSSVQDLPEWLIKAFSEKMKNRTSRGRNRTHEYAAANDTITEISDTRFEVVLPPWTLIISDLLTTLPGVFSLCIYILIQVLVCKARSHSRHLQGIPEVSWRSRVLEAKTNLLLASAMSVISSFGFPLALALRSFHRIDSLINSKPESPSVGTAFTVFFMVGYVGLTLTPWVFVYHRSRLCASLGRQCSPKCGKRQSKDSFSSIEKTTKVELKVHA